MFGFLKKEIPTLPKLPGQDQEFIWQAGQKVVYSVAGAGAPLLLLHGINAAAWAFEMRKNIEPLSQAFKVYAPDLPGYGRSERRPVRYTAADYINFVTDFARYIKSETGQAPATVVSSVSSAYVVAAAAANPDLFGALVLICPTGLERLDFEPGKTATRINKILRGKAGDLVFWLLTLRSNTRLFLGRDAYFDKQMVTEEVLDGYYNTARQPNAKYAPVSFVTFFLNHSLKTEWPATKNPALIVWGKDATMTPPENAAKFLELRPDTDLKIIGNARIALHDEHSTEFNQMVLSWLKSQAAQAGQPSVLETSAPKPEFSYSVPHPTDTFATGENL